MSAAQPRHLDLWYRDTVSCLQSTLAAILSATGERPLDVLGLGWEFLYLPGDVRAEEFYWACQRPGDLVGSVLPHHRATSSWKAIDESDPIAPLAQCLQSDRWPIVAVDNYYLPFRPAFGDVHSAHLLIVTDADLAAGIVHVSDAMPPAYQGPLPVRDLVQAWRSPNPREQEAFFSGSRIGGRWLDVDLRTPYPGLDQSGLVTALVANAAGFRHAADPGAGLTGLRTFGESLVEAARAGTSAVVEQAYCLGWGLQAQAALHAELLTELSTRWRLPRLAEAGAKVHSVALAWTSVRVTAAYARVSPQSWVADLARHCELLHRAHIDALQALDAVIEELA